MEVELKEVGDSLPTKVEYHEFKARIQRGELGPKVLIRDRVLTNGEWWALDELNIFHNHSPTPYPLSERLRRKREALNEQKDAETRCAAQRAEYIHGDLIDRRYHLIPLQQLLGERDVYGVTRLYVLRAFEPERIFTFIFRKKNIRIYVAQGQTALWYSLPQVGSINGVWQESIPRPFDSEQIHRAIEELAIERAPEPLRRWPDVAQASRQATSCPNEHVSDGVVFEYQLMSEDEEVSVKWYNPSPGLHKAQTQLVKAYHDCICTANLSRFWQGWTL